MNKLNLVIIEDEKPAARRLNRMLQKNNYPEAFLLHDIQSSIAYLNQHTPDLILLDVQLSDGISFEIFKEVEVNCPIIFTTAYDEFAIQAFQLNSIDYLLKPLEEDKLIHALQKWEKLRQDTFNADELRDFLNSQNTKSSYKNRFTVQVGHKIIVIEANDISCFYSENKSTFLLTKLGRSYDLDFSLDQLENKLNPIVFFRISRKYIIHKNHIKEIYAHTNSRCKVMIEKSNFQDMIVSRERTKEFKVWLEE